MLLRLLFDVAAAFLLIAALAYYWGSNLSHELIGSVFFLLIGLHGWFNRRWYLNLLRGRYDARRRVTAIVNLGFLAVMTMVLVTSIMISRSVFGFIGIEAGYGAREVHMFAAYWAAALLGVHLGANWQKVIQICRTTFGIRPVGLTRKWVLRVIATGTAIQGICASSEMAFGTKLSLGYSLDMWDFNARTPRFFFNYINILGLYAVLAHLFFSGIGKRGYRSPRR